VLAKRTLGRCRSRKETAYYSGARSPSRNLGPIFFWPRKGAPKYVVVCAGAALCGKLGGQIRLSSRDGEKKFSAELISKDGTSI
jgi:hypothetical protein